MGGCVTGGVGRCVTGGVGGCVTGGVGGCVIGRMGVIVGVGGCYSRVRYVLYMGGKKLLNDFSP